MTMACKTNFLKVVFNLDGTLTLVRCCGAESNLQNCIQTSLPEEYLDDATKLFQFLKEKAYTRPQNFSAPVLRQSCQDTCEKLFDKSFPITELSFGLPVCNLACPTCRKEQILRADEKIVQNYFKALNAFKGTGIQILIPNLSGEPFFYKKEMREFLNNLAPTDFGMTVIVSNLTVLNDTDIQCLQDAKNRGVELQVHASIDSVKEETFKKLRFPSTSAMYKNALDNFDKLQQAGVYVVPTVTISTVNSSFEELEALGEYFSSRNVPIHAVLAMGNDEEWLSLSKNPVIKEWAQKFKVRLRIT